MKNLKTLAPLVWPAFLAFACLFLVLSLDDLGALLGRAAPDGLRLLVTSGGYFALAWLGARSIEISFRHREKRRRPVPQLLRQLVWLVLFALALSATAMLFLGHGPSGLLAGSGLALAFLGFAVRNVVADTLSGIALGLEGPFRIGDWVEFEDGARGRIIDIGWRTTRILTSDSTYLILPNSQIARQKLTNYSAPRREYRAQVEIVLDHDLPVAVAREMLGEVLKGSRLILQEPAPDIRVQSYTPDGIRYALRYWVPRFDRDVDCRDEVFERIDEALRTRKIAPPRQRFEIARAWKPAQGRIANGRTAPSASALAAKPVEIIK